VKFKVVAGVVVFCVKDGKKKVLLGLRREGREEAGKWGIFAGTGALKEAKNLMDFAWSEFTADLALADLERPERLTPLIFVTPALDVEEAVSEFYLKLQVDPGWRPALTEEEWSPAEIQWFSKEEVDGLRIQEKLAFNTFNILSSLWG